MGNAGAFLRDYAAGNRMGGDPLLDEEIENPIGRGPGGPFGNTPINPIGRGPSNPFGDAPVNPIGRGPGFPGLPPGEIAPPIGRGPGGPGSLPEGPIGS